MLWVLATAILFLFLFIFFELYKKPLEALFLKAFASFGFLLVFSYALYVRFDELIQMGNLSDDEIMPFKLALLILLGLVAGTFGDIHLGIRPLQDASKDKQIIVGGIVYFAIGHIFYLIALLSIGTFSYLSVSIGLIMTIVIFIGSKVLHFEMGIAKYPTLFYTFLIFMMVGQALANAIATNFDTFSTLIFMGSILFSLSDLLLAPIYYKGNKQKIMISTNLITYYAAQLLIAYSVLYII